jgi:hypothetical protein
MIARLSALDATFAPRGPQEGIMGKTLRIIIDPKANRTTPMSSIARPAPACGNRCSMPRGKALYPLLTAELDAMKALRPKGGLMLRRDGSGLPWGGKGEMLTQVERISKKTILAAGLRPELTFTSLGRHGGATEANTSGRTETQLMTKGQRSSTAAMGNYLHDDDEGKQDAQMKRMKRRAKYSKG